jgi:hypothetical protein
MSLEICVLSDARLSTVAEWQHAIDAEGFALRLADAKPFRDLRGLLPSYLHNQKTTFECHHVRASLDMIRDISAAWHLPISTLTGAYALHEEKADAA